MFDSTDLIILVGSLLVIVFAGVHIAIALGVTSVLGIYLMTDDIEVARNFVGNTAYEALRDYVFAVIPLFMLMGEFLAKCGAAKDMFALMNKATGFLRGRLAVDDRARQRGVRVRHRGQHRRGGGVLAHRVSGNEALRLRARLLARLHRRQRLPGHADSAERADDRVGRAHRGVDRQAVPRRRAAGLPRW